MQDHIEPLSKGPILLEYVVVTGAAGVIGGGSVFGYIASAWRCASGCPPGTPPFWMWGVGVLVAIAIVVWALVHAWRALSSFDRGLPLVSAVLAIGPLVVIGIGVLIVLVMSPAGWW